MTRPAVLVAPILAFAGSYASAQTPGRIGGRAVDQTGAPLPEVTIDRHFGPRPRIEDATVKSGSTAIWNGEAGYRVSRTARVVLEVFNLFDARVSDIDYFYVSRLQDEPGDGVADIHTHPALPRTVRVGVQVSF